MSCQHRRMADVSFSLMMPRAGDAALLAKLQDESRRASAVQGDCPDAASL